MGTVSGCVKPVIVQALPLVLAVVLEMLLVTVVACSVVLLHKETYKVMGIEHWVMFLVASQLAVSVHCLLLSRAAIAEEMKTKQALKGLVTVVVEWAVAGWQPVMVCGSEVEYQPVMILILCALLTQGEVSVHDLHGDVLQLGFLTAFAGAFAEAAAAAACITVPAAV